MTSPSVSVYRQDSQNAQSCCQYISVLCKYVLMETMAKVWMTVTEMHKAALFLFDISISTVSYKLLYVEEWLQEAGQDSHLCFYCLYCYCQQTTSLQYRKEKGTTVLQHCTKEKTKNVNIGFTPYAELYMLGCMENHTAVCLNLLTSNFTVFLSFGSFFKTVLTWSKLS